MTAYPDTAYVPLNETLFLKLKDATGTTISCVSGCLWITRDGCIEDTLMTAGQSYRVEDSTRVIVTAFGASLAQVSRPVRRTHPTLRALTSWPFHRPVNASTRLASAAVTAPGRSRAVAGFTLLNASNPDAVRRRGATFKRTAQLRHYASGSARTGTGLPRSAAIASSGSIRATYARCSLRPD